MGPASEVCNGLDDDCDGQVDDGVATTFVVDGDGDGFGSAATNAQTVEACSAPAGFVAARTDCDDAVAAINPSATEVCDGAGVDEDCDGTPNEGCACNPPGAMQPCCGGRGFQTCDTVGGGTAWSACNAPGVAEVCNGLDDDCDGQVDEMAFLGGPDGGAAEWDGGSARPDGTCTLGQGACAAAGMTSCAAGALVCSATPGAPGSETCNGQDDDCDGQVDEAGPGLCAVTGQTCAAATCACPSGQSVCNGACATLSTEVCDGQDNDCDGQVDEAGPGLCAVTGQTCAAATCACPSGQSVCNGACATPATETCNGQDDDCDGQVDEAGPGLCAVTGQTCAAATCACPSGQSVCNGACATLSTEVCDGVDNDCDGQVDEALTIACAADADGDGYADGAATTQQCPTAARPQAGNCPLGFVAPASSLGADCDATNGGRYRLVSSRSDADGDTACAGAAANDCVGTTALPGRRFVTACNVTDDCNDADAAKFQLALSRSDADGDTACVGPSSLDCVGATALPGRRFTAACNATDDCNDANIGLYRLMSSRNDSDNDGYCAGAAANDCVGSTPLSGRRFAANCLAPDDCNDANGAVFRIASVRADADNDMWCAGTATNQCIGSSPPAGLRLAANCAGDDCRDSNAQATSACVLPGAYYTSSRAQTCPNPTQSTSLTVLGFCPIGFTLGGYNVQILSGLGQCVATGPAIISQTCNFLEGTNCRIVGDCVAL